MVDLRAMTVEDLASLEKEVKAVLKEKRAAEREERKANQERLDKENRGKFSDGDRVVFWFNKEKTVGTIVRQSEKSVTVEFDLGGEVVKRYRKYSDLIGLAD